MLIAVICTGDLTMRARHHEFAAAAASPAADRAVLDGALAMSWTTIDLANDPVQRARLGARAYRHA